MALPPQLDARIPPGPLPDKWQRYQATVPLVSQANKKTLSIIPRG